MVLGPYKDVNILVSAITCLNCQCFPESQWSKWAKPHSISGALGQCHIPIALIMAKMRHALKGHGAQTYPFIPCLKIISQFVPTSSSQLHFLMSEILLQFGVYTMNPTHALQWTFFFDKVHLTSNEGWSETIRTTMISLQQSAFEQIMPREWLPGVLCWSSSWLAGYDRTTSTTWTLPGIHGYGLWLPVLCKGHGMTVQLMGLPGGPLWIATLKPKGKLSLQWTDMVKALFSSSNGARRGPLDSEFGL